MNRKKISKLENEGAIIGNYGTRIGYALFDGNKQVTRALFGQKTALSKGYKSGREEALHMQERYKMFFDIYRTVKRAVTYY